MLSVVAPAADALELTAEERAYVRTLPPVTMCVDSDWRPYEWVDERGIHRGIAADLLRLVARRVGIALELVRTADWEESLAASKAGRCKILSFLNQTEKRDVWLNFTAPVLSDPNVFVTRQDHPLIADPAALRGETIVFPAGTAMEEMIRRDYPNLRVVVVESEEEALAWVDDRRADMTMRSRIVAAYVIRGEGLFNLKIAGQLPDYVNRLRIGVAKSETVLREVLDQGVASLSRADLDDAINNYVTITVQEEGLDYGLALRLFGMVAALVAVGGVYHVRLQRLNRELVRLSRTDALTGLSNRAHVDAELARELDRARRYGHACAIVMFDVDDFKAINDRQGHAEGDRVLCAIASVIAETVRASDLVGRWGGEEFLVLCPETSADDARALAERVRLAVRGLGFGDGRIHTISAGVAEISGDGGADDLLRRADAALYDAKRAGRDRVCVAATG